MEIRYEILLGGVALVCSACNSTGPAISTLNGSYNGTLTELVNNGFSRSAVTAAVPSDATSGQKSVVITGAGGAVLLEIALSNLTDTSVTVSMPSLSAVTLQFDAESGCYYGQALSKISLCASGPEIDFEMSDLTGATELSLLLYLNNPAPLPSESPSAYTLSQAIEISKKMSFQSRIEFEHVIQARKTAQAAYFHLLPQLTLPTIENNLSASFSSVLGAIADLAPFLLPSRWIKAKEATDQSEAEQDSNRLMRLDMASQTEGLFYTYDRDQKMLGIYNDFAQRLSSVLITVQAHENSGSLSAGSTDTLQAAINDLTHNSDVLTSVLVEDKAAIAQSLGFFDPLTVQDATIDLELFPVTNPVKVDYEVVNPEAIQRSVELDQFTFLINEAKLGKKEEFFDWMDPVGDPNLGLGAALPTEISIAQSQVNELQIAEEQEQSEISQKVLNAVTDYNQAIDNYQDAQSDLVLHEHRLTTMIDQLGAGSGVDVFDLCSIISDDLGARLSIEQSNLDYRVARAGIDRMLLQGFYQ